MDMDRITESLANIAMAEIERTGGVTLEGRTLLKQEWSTGYMVGVGGIVIRYSDLDSPDALAWLARRVGGEYMTAYVGFWRDGDDLYIDGVRYVRDLVSAEALARKHGQKAIYDWELRESRFIPLTEDHDR